jgi:hypothetical protein
VRASDKPRGSRTSRRTNGDTGVEAQRVTTDEMRKTCVEVSKTTNPTDLYTGKRTRARARDNDKEVRDEEVRTKERYEESRRI